MSAKPPSTEDLVGRTIAGKYEIVRRLGEGGMGTVYQARQIAMERMVALKVIRPELVLTPEVAGRFQTEMRVTARIEHPNTVRLYDVFESEGRLYLAMELLGGTPLSDVIATGVLDLPRIVHIGKQIANALGAIHAHGVIHRDLKPDNVILLEAYGNRDFVKVLDFGVAKPLDQQGVNLTATGTIVGTPAYMAPEQALARPTDARADLYSLGIMLYQMVAGRVPFAATTMTSMLIAHATEPPPPIEQVAPGTSPALAGLIMQLIEKDPAARPQTAAEVIARLDACLGALGTSAMVSTPPPPPRKKSRLGLWLALSVLLVGGGVAAALLVPGATTATTSVDAAAVAVPVKTAPTPDAGRAAVVTAAPPDAAHKAAAGTSDAAATVAAAPPDAAAAKPPAAVSRAELDAILAKAGEPLAPESCRATDAETVKKLEAAARAIFAGDAFNATAALAGAPATSVEALALRARAELVDDARKALATAEEAAKLCPEYAVAHNLAGNALQKLGKIDDAEEAYGRALGEVPAYEAPRFNLGLSQLRRKDKGAVWTFTELIKRRPDYPNVYLVRAQAYLQQGKKDEALADLEEATHRQPQSAEAWAALGQLREFMKKPDANAAYCEAKKLGHAAGKKCAE